VRPFVVRVAAIPSGRDDVMSHRARRTTMRYLLLIYTPETSDQPPPEARQAMTDAYAVVTQEMRERGLFQAGEALEPTSTATTVRVRDGETLTTDGPFAETKEALGGFYLVSAADLDEAIEIAAKIPGARLGSIEIRPIRELPSEYADAASVAEVASR
jgi:hypothetical protein